MIKKFFAAMIVCLLVMSAQIASASNIDWKKVPRINSKAELATYIENGRRKGQTTFYFIFTGEKISNWAEHNNFQSEIAQSNFLYVHLIEGGDLGSGRFICKITKEHPGTRVANAYLSRDISKLTPDELELYQKALPIVNEAKKRPTEIEKELYIHDEICKRVNFKDPQENPDAFAALVTGETNCQGYSDAFYMLGRMVGLNVRRIGGKFNGNFHIWNTITFDDGKTYCVDVTQDDWYYSDKKKNRYFFFNMPLEVVQSIYQYPWEAIDNLQRNIDNRYSYCCLTNHAQASSAEEGLKLIAQKIGKENFSRFSVMAPYDERFSEANRKQNADYVVRAAGKAIVLYTEKYGKYLFFTGVLP